MNFLQIRKLFQILEILWNQHFFKFRSFFLNASIFFSSRTFCIFLIFFQIHKLFSSSRNLLKYTQKNECVFLSNSWIVFEFMNIFWIHKILKIHEFVSQIREHFYFNFVILICFAFFQSQPVNFRRLTGWPGQPRTLRQVRQLLASRCCVGPREQTHCSAATQALRKGMPSHRNERNGDGVTLPI